MSFASIAQERTNNVFLRAMRPGMPLHLELDRCRPVNAVLVPCCTALDGHGVDESMMTSAFLKAHCVRSLSKVKTTFITVLGTKGDFSPGYDQVTVGTKCLSVLRRMPLDVQAGYSDDVPDVYIVSDLAVSLDDIRAEDAKNGRKTNQVAAVDDDSQTSFKEFQIKLQDRRVKHVARSIKTFISQDAAAITPQAVRLFLDTQAEELLKIDMWGPMGEDVRNRENVFEDLERFVLAKIYDTCLAVVSDPQTAELVHARIGLLSPWVTARQLHVPEPCVHQKQWRQAVQSLAKMAEFKAPKDKVVCMLNAITYVTHALRRTEGDTGADVLHPAVILCVGHANPKGFADQLKFIAQYRWKEKLKGDVQYNLAVMQGAAAFWSSCGPRELAMDPQDYAEALNGKPPPPMSSASSIASMGPNTSQMSLTSSAVVGSGVQAAAAAAAAAAASPAPGASAAPPPKKAVPADRLQIIDPTEGGRREQWDVTFDSRSQEVDEQRALDGRAQKAAEDEVMASLAQVERQLDAEMQLLKSASKAEEAVDTSRLHSWQSALVQRESGLSAAQQQCHDAIKRVNDFISKHLKRCHESAVNTRKATLELQTESDRRSVSSEAKLNAFRDLLLKKEAVLEQGVREANDNLTRANAELSRSRAANEAYFGAQLENLRQQENDLKVRIEAAESRFAEKAEALRVREAALHDDIEQARKEQADEDARLSAARDTHEKFFAGKISEFEARESDLRAAATEAQKQLEIKTTALERAKEEFESYVTATQQTVSQRAADLDDLDKRLQTRALEVDRAAAASQEAHARRDAELKRRASELESAVASSRASIAHRTADLSKQAQVNQEHLSVGMSEVNRLRAEVHQRMVDDRATIAAIQSNLDDRHALLTKREAELQSKMKEALDEAKAFKLTAAQHQRETIGVAVGHYRDGMSRIDASDFLGQVTGYDNLKISDLQNLWKTMDALRALRGDFQTRLDQLNQTAASLPTA